MIPLWYLAGGLLVAFGLGLWCGVGACSYHRGRRVERARRAAQWNS